MEEAEEGNNVESEDEQVQELQEVDIDQED